MEIATQLLIDRLRALKGPTLWLVDEQIDRAAIAAAPVRADLFALGNRYDTVAALNKHGISATLNDFDIAAVPPFTHAVFRVAKEKALVHYVINRALERLPAGGTLWLTGEKNDGIKTYAEKAALRADVEVQRERHGAAQIVSITRGENLGEPLDDQQYAQARRLELATNFFVWSKPGIFGWQKLDAGSAYLCEYLDDVWTQPPQRVLDLGCGYGYLTLRAATRWSHAQFVATDNNIAAVDICRRNLGERAVVDPAFAGRAECADCGNTLQEAFDAILCNPPFHQGFAHEPALTEKFLRETKRLLTRGGRALFVVNQFIALEKIATPLFKRVDVIARNKSFKLVALGN